jgi:hypothetical protein
LTFRFDVGMTFGFDLDRAFRFGLDLLVLSRGFVVIVRRAEANIVKSIFLLITFYVHTHNIAM